MSRHTVPDGEQKLSALYYKLARAQVGCFVALTGFQYHDLSGCVPQPAIVLQILLFLKRALIVRKRNDGLKPALLRQYKLGKNLVRSDGQRTQGNQRPRQSRDKPGKLSTDPLPCIL